MTTVIRTWDDDGIEVKCLCRVTLDDPRDPGACAEVEIESATDSEGNDRLEDLNADRDWYGQVEDEAVQLVRFDEDPLFDTTDEATGLR